LSRTLYIYVNNEKAADSKELAEFVDFYMTKRNLTRTVKEAGYAPLHATEIEASISTWKSAAS
jgi:ABC-type phosphate transport system substrate-binding protein